MKKILVLFALLFAAFSAHASMIWRAVAVDAAQFAQIEKNPDMLARMLFSKSGQTISLDKELNILDIYLQLEKVRLKNNFEYTIDIDDEVATEELQVPTLILQPFAENAIWHGLVNKTGDRRLLIKGEIRNDMLHFFIKDNGIGRKQAQHLKPDAVKHQSKGIELIQQRLDIIKNKANNPNTSFVIHDLYNEGVPAGTCVEISLPLDVT